MERVLFTSGLRIVELPDEMKAKIRYLQGRNCIFEFDFGIDNEFCMSVLKINPRSTNCVASAFIKDGDERVLATKVINEAYEKLNRRKKRYDTTI